MIHGHGGNIYHAAKRLGCKISDIIDMSSNVNPLGPPAGLLTFLKENIHSILALPEVDAQQAVQAFARRYQLNPKHILAGNGTTQFIYAIPKILETQNAMILGPTYSDYADACRMNHVPYQFLFAQESQDFQPNIDEINRLIPDFDAVFICNPNNPTGALIPADTLQTLCQTHPTTYFIIDESYLPFVPNGSQHDMAPRNLPNAIVLNSMSKIFRIPGLRIGFVVSYESVIEKFMRYVLPWSVNSLAQAAVIYLMEAKDETDAFIKTTALFLEQERNKFIQQFKTSDSIHFFPSTTSFLLAKLLHRPASEICDTLIQERILIRNCSNFSGLSDFFIRISLKTEKINRLAAEKILMR